MKTRGSGVLLHITSLASPYGIGDLGPAAYAFADFLAASKQKYWQILPVNPTDPVFDNSPYHSFSAFAANPLLISPELMTQEGLLTPEDIESLPEFPKERVDFDRGIPSRKKIFDVAYERFKQKGDIEDFEKYCAEMASWLEDYALFEALKSRFRKKVWSKWPSDIKDRKSGIMEIYRSELHEEIKKAKFLQHVFYRQWNRLKDYCNRKGILIFGDIPIYVVHDSVDVWTHPELFKLDPDREPFVVAGVPPDYFSKTGQLWGNPLYRWDVLKRTGYDWWIRRLEHNLKLFDVVRIDHFRGLVGYWEIPARENTAVNGKWVQAEAMDFFDRLNQRFSTLPIVAEDLGTITPDVEEIRERFGFPGMKVLLFAFGEDNPDHPYLPHTYEKNCVVYTGTHDNNTVRDWFKTEAKTKDKRRLFQYLGHQVTEQDVHRAFIEMGMKSEADTFIVPMQDLLGLGAEARMNRPATKRGNWSWRLLPDKLTSLLAENFAELTQISNRA
jgi:4-alpha-glucanotransferase